MKKKYCKNCKKITSYYQHYPHCGFYFVIICKECGKGD